VCVCESSELRIFYSLLSSLVPDPESVFGLLGTTKSSCLIRADTSLSSPPPCDYLWVFNLSCSNRWGSCVQLVSQLHPAPKLYTGVGLLYLARYKTLLINFFQFHTFPCFCVAITTCDLKCELFLFSQLPELIFFCCLGGLQANVYPMCVCITPHQLFSCYCLESGRLSYPVARFRCRSSIF